LNKPRSPQWKKELFENAVSLFSDKLFKNKEKELEKIKKLEEKLQFKYV
jgi:hypothetical protein